MEERKFYTDWHDLRDDGSIVLYKRIDRKKPKFIARIKIPEHRDYIVKSTKTADLSDARRIAERMYYDYETRVRDDLPMSNYTFGRLFREFEPRYLRQHQNTKHSPEYIKANLNVIRRHFLEFAEKTLVSEINERFIEDYFDWRMKRGVRTPTGSTFHHERTILNHIFKFAVREGHLKVQPSISIPQSKSKPRPDISLRDYRKIVKSMKRELDSSVDERIRRSRLYSHVYFLVLANTGIRKGEIAKVKWKDISPAKDLGGKSTVIIAVSGKTGSRLVVANPSTVDYLQRVHEQRTKELNGEKPSKNELVFCKPNGKPIGEMRKPFERLLEQSGTLYVDGEKRTIYSLRHTYITMRLSHGTPIYFLAMNCGTSVEMIEKYYGKKRVSDPKIISQITQMSFNPRDSDTDLSFLN